MSDCYACSRDAADDLAPWERVHVDEHWRVAHAFDASLPGWLVVLPRRHVLGLHELTDDEAGNLGPLLRRLSLALVAATGCEKTYVMPFAEAEGFAHLHVHVVPRQADLPPDTRGPRVFTHLGVPPEQRVPVPERNALAARLQQAMR